MNLVEGKDMKNSSVKKIYIINILFFLIASISIIVSNVSYDAEYQMAMGYRLLKGDTPILEMWEPNQTSAFLCAIIMKLYISIAGTTTGIVLFVNVMGYLVYAVTDARTSYLLVIAVSLVALIFAKTNLDKLLDYISVKVYYVCITVLSIGILSCGYFYREDSAFSVKIDSILNNRVRLMNEAFNKYGVSLFGENIQWVGFGGQTNTQAVENAYNFVDCAYAKMLFDHGLIFAILVCVGYAFMYKYAVQKKDYILILAVTMVLVVSIMEPRLISIEMNPFVLLLGLFFVKENKSRFKFIL